MLKVRMTTLYPARRYTGCSEIPFCWEGSVASVNLLKPTRVICAPSLKTKFRFITNEKTAIGKCASTNKTLFKTFLLPPQYAQPTGPSTGLFPSPITKPSLPRKWLSSTLWDKVCPRKTHRTDILSLLSPETRAGGPVSVSAVDVLPIPVVLIMCFLNFIFCHWWGFNTVAYCNTAELLPRVMTSEPTKLMS